MLIRRILVLLHALLLAIASGASLPALGAGLETAAACVADATPGVMSHADFGSADEAVPAAPAAETSSAEMAVELPEALELPALAWSDAALIEALPDPASRGHAAPYLEGLQRPPRQGH